MRTLSKAIGILLAATLCFSAISFAADGQVQQSSRHEQGEMNGIVDQDRTEARDGSCGDS